MRFLLPTILLVLASCQPKATLFAAVNPDLAAKQLVYPETKRIDHVDTLHGQQVADPYRWLEDDVRNSPEVAKWVEEQNKVTFGYLGSVPQREALRTRLTKIWNYERYSNPFREGNRYFYFKNDGLQNQSVLYTMRSLDGTPEVLLDPNTWSKDGTIALGGMAISDDGRTLAYGVQDAGSDWETWRVMDIATKKTLDDELKWVKFSGASFTHDGKGFYYSRFPAPKEGQAFQGANTNQAVYYHRVGTPQSKDKLIIEDPKNPEWGFGATVSEDGRYLVVTVWKGTDDRYRILYQDLKTKGAKFITLIDKFEYDYSFIHNVGTKFYFRTNNAAPRGRIIAIDVRKPDPKNWAEIVPQSNDTLVSGATIGGQLAVNYLHDAATRIALYDLKGKLIREVALPGIGTAGGFGGKTKDTEAFYSFSSFATPPQFFRYNLKTGKSTLFRSPKVDFNPNDFEVTQVFYTSKDGTRIPMFLTSKKGLKRDGNNPTFLYGYGGFNVSITPYFSASRIAWLEMGGVLAVANIRGGGEYGEAWHKAGTKANKQNVFDDFIAAAEWLVKEKVTSTPKLAINGGSNGGLLVGAVMTQRPDLFGAAIPQVGVMDMLRFHQFTAGRYWVDDYGSADDADEFKVLRAYSPYHNIKDGAKYPATLITTADTDDRVVPGHSFKFAAALQKANASANPILIRIQTRAGHGAGKPTAILIEEAADQWAFLVKALGMSPQLAAPAAASSAAAGAGGH